MPDLTLTAQPRELTGKKVRRLRRAGVLPAVIYGPSIPAPRSIQVDRRSFEAVYRAAGTTQLVDLVFDDQSRTRLFIRDVQYNLLQRQIVHVDFYAANLSVEVTLAVPITLVGEAPVAARGEGVLTQIQNTVTVKAMPTGIPSHIDVDISGIESVDDTVRVEHLNVAEGITVVDSPDVVLISVTRPRVEEEVEEALVADVAAGAAAAVAAETQAEAVEDGTPAEAETDETS